MRCDVIQACVDVSRGDYISASFTLVAAAAVSSSNASSSNSSSCSS